MLPPARFSTLLLAGKSFIPAPALYLPLRPQISLPVITLTRYNNHQPSLVNGEMGAAFGQYLKSASSLGEDFQERRRLLFNDS